MKPEHEIMELCRKAEEEYKECLKKVKKHAGTYSSEALEIMQDLALFYASIGDRVIEDGDSLDGSKNISLFTNKKIQTGNMKAEKLLSWVAKQRKIDLGPDSILTASTIQHLANIQLNQTDLDPKAFASAEPNFLSAMEKFKRILGESHPKTLAAVRDIGMFYFKKGNYNKAELYFEKCAEKYAEKFGN
jgi:tetratricopeptide (TPR) repeat protein